MTVAQPAQLGREALAEFRDLWVFQPSCTFAASIEELMAWDEQLYEAIQSGELDARASWAIEEDERAQRLAELVVAKVLATLPPQPASVTSTAIVPSLAAPNEIAEADAMEQAPLPELVRAADVSMTAREWRGAVKRGELRVSKVGREYLATRADYELYLAAKRVEPSAKSAKRPKPKSGAPAARLIDRALASGHLQAIPLGGRR